MTVVRSNKPLELPYLSNSLKNFDIDSKTLEYLQEAWRPSTKKVYSSHLKRWSFWAFNNKVRVLNPGVKQILKFLREYFETGVGYGAINAARCALSVILPKIDGRTVGENYLVRWLCKSFYERRPPQPRYANFWSVEKVLRWILTLQSNSKLSWKILSYKLVILLLLVSSQRGQTILALLISRMNFTKDSVTFRMKTLLKHNSLGQPLDSITFYNYPKDKRLCVVRTLKSYIERTKGTRRDDQLLLSYIGPHGPISRATLARWTISALELSGVNTEAYKGHSTRGAAASAAKALGASLNAIMRNASWKDSKSFARHYHKSLESPDTVQNILLGSVAASKKKKK